MPLWCTLGLSDPTVCTKAALIAYVGDRATNIARYAGGVNAAVANQMLDKLLHDAVRDHRDAAAVVISSFVRRQRT